MLGTKAITIAKWEIREKLRRKSFYIFSLLFPAIIIVLSLIPILISSNKTESSSVIGIFSENKKLVRSLLEVGRSEFISHNQSPIIFLNINTSKNQKSLKEFAKTEILAGTIDGAIILPDNESDRNLLLYNPSLGANSILKIQEYLSIAENKLNDSSISNTNIVNLTAMAIDQDNNNDYMIKFYQPFSLVVLLVFLSLFTGGTFVRTFLLEKSNGMIEIYLSTCRPIELMTGKLLGIIITGIIQLSVWIFLIILYSNSFGNIHLDAVFFIQIVYFLLGYTLFSSIFLASASIISSEYQAQQLTSIISLIAILPILLSLPVLQEPESLYTIFLKYFPLTLPHIQILLVNSDSFNLLQFLITFTIGAAATFLIILIASKLFKSTVLLDADKLNISKLFKVQ
jgi:ABC-2 type transport system permease protein